MAKHNIIVAIIAYTSSDWQQKMR